MSHSLSSLLTHVIFGTKDRIPCISNNIQSELWRYIGGIVRELEGSALIVNGMADHAHILLQLPSSLSIADAMRVAKTNSSRWVREKWPGARFSWQTGYGAFSVSRSNVPDVMEYIRKQDEHHKRISFQDEFLALLKKHGVTYDEKYIWK
jgi:REP element-mobilizing transposase RayT